MLRPKEIHHRRSRSKIVPCPRLDIWLWCIATKDWYSIILSENHSYPKIYLSKHLSNIVDDPNWIADSVKQWAVTTVCSGCRFALLEMLKCSPILKQRWWSANSEGLRLKVSFTSSYREGHHTRRGSEEESGMFILGRGGHICLCFCVCGRT